eukprot:Amastigsp_a176903_12.p3 type:complete len:227 gc:universal Amastigsp_a176903_12:1550-870(-)
MTACFSLRLRLKVYSLIMCFSDRAFAPSNPHAYIQRPTVSDFFQNHSAAGPPSALAVLRRLSGGLASCRTNGPGWPAGAETPAAHHFDPPLRADQIPAITPRWFACRRERPHPSLTTLPLSSNKHPCWTQAWPWSARRSVQPGCPAACRCRKSDGRWCHAQYRPCRHGTGPDRPWRFSRRWRHRASPFRLSDSASVRVGQGSGPACRRHAWRPAMRSRHRNPSCRP